MTNEDFLKEAISLAVENARIGGGPFGAVIVKDGRVIARGVNKVTILNDPTAHAEVMAIRKASEVLGDFNLAGCELYSSCEPCPMCLGAIYWARLDKVYFGAGKDDAAKYGFDDRAIEIQLKSNLEDRSISMKQMLQKEAIEAFVEWNNNVDKRSY